MGQASKDLKRIPKHFRGKRHPVNTTIVYWILDYVCRFCNWVSFLDPVRRKSYRYLVVEVLILSSIGIGVICLMNYSKIPNWGQKVLLIGYAYRITTMAFAHISILLFHRAKSTSAQRVHSRARYLVLTALNLVEIVIFGSLLTLSIEPLGTQNPQHYSLTLNEILDVVYYNFRIATSFAAERIYPQTPEAYLHNIIISILGIEIFAVIIAIVLSIRPEDEETTRLENPGGLDYWEWRSASFEESQWASNTGLVQEIIDKIPRPNVVSVADIGCGTGHLSTQLHAGGYSVYGIDSCSQMVDVAKRYSPADLHYHIADASCLPLGEHSIDAVVMRMLLHNLINPAQQRLALEEAYRILKKQGSLVVVEDFPPDEKCRTFFQKVLSREHARIFFTEERLEQTLQTAGFAIQSRKTVVVKRMSVRSWLYEAVPTRKRRNEIFKLHLEMPNDCKKEYNMEITRNDLFIDIHFLIILAMSQHRVIGSNPS